MAFQAKNDYCGLTAITALSSALTIRDDAENATKETYQAQGQDGSFLAIEAYGDDAAPTNSYGIKAGGFTLSAGDVSLNAITTINNKNYALESINITTAAGAAPTMSATAQLVESGAADATQCLYEVPALTVTSKQHAQILFSSFTLTGSGCSLTECSATIGGTVNKDKVAGVIIASDINSGLVTVTGTILQTGSTAPTVTPATGWVLTKPPTCTNPETAYKNYTFELQLPLAKAS